MAKTKRVVQEKKPLKKTKMSFFDFQGNKFTKLAREYHHELSHLTGDLLRVNRKIQESATLCHLQISFIKRKEQHLISPSRPVCFSDALYHIENFAFRVTGYRDKLVQFINQALRIGFDEKTMGVLTTIVSHGTVRDAHLDTELKKFDKDSDFKVALSERILMTHRRYYSTETGYSSMLMSGEESKDPDMKLKLWKQNIQTKASRANRIALKARDMNDRVMQKINAYLKKHPLR